MSRALAQQAGDALVWRAAQLLGGKALLLVRYLVLARLLSPEEFGLFAIAVVPLDVLLSATNFGMIPALVQRKESREQHYNAAWTVGLARALAIGAVVFVGAPILADFFSEPRAVPLLRALALRPVLGALASIKVADLERGLRFRSLAMLDLTSALVAAAVSIALASAFGAWALIAGTLIGALAGTLLSYTLAPHRPRLALDLGSARPLFRFGRWIMISGLVEVVGDAVLRAVVSRELGTAQLGLYFLAATLALLPNDVVSGIVTAVAFPVHAQVQSDPRRVGLAFRASFAAMAAVLIPAYAIIAALAPSIVQHVLSPQWSGTEPVIRILAIAGILGILFDATSPMLQGRGQPQKLTVLFAVLTVSVITSAWALTRAYGLMGAAMAWVFAQAVVFGACIIFAGHALGHPAFRGLAKPLTAIVLTSGIVGALAWSVDALLPGIMGVGAATATATGFTGAILWTLDRHLDLGLARDLARAFPRLAERLRLPLMSA